MYRATVAGAAALVGLTLTACSSSTPGAGSGGGSRGASTKSSSVVSAARPQGGSSAAAVGSDKSPWCAEVGIARDSVLQGRPDPTASLSPQDEQIAQQLAADAPSDIRSDVQTLLHYEVALAHGQSNDPSAQHYFQAATHVAQWLQTNCPTVFHKLNPGLNGPSAGSS